MVKGPARVFVKGTCYVLGRNVSGQTVKVRSGRALPFEPTGMCRLQAQLGPGAAMWWADPRQAGTYMWRSLAERVFALAAAKERKTANTSATTNTVMLVGDTDTGKSTLAIYLANMALRRGLAASVIDGDIGQGDLAPPTAIGATILPKPVVDLRDVDVNTNLFEFIGNITPAGFEGLIAKKLGMMLGRTRPLADICIVNTDGYVRDGGVQYKEMIAEELQPDVVICLGYDDDNNNNTNDVVSLFDGKEHMVGSWHILRARSSSQVYKSRLERINRRLDQFLRYVGSGLSIVNLSQVKFNYADKLFPPSELFEPPIKQLELENMKEMFVGLGSNGRVTGFGVIRNIDLENSRMYIQTNLISSFDNIYLSNIRL
ncbi:MAG TPA: Clp1/GlmU family protein, partial [Nitrososphaera sp.]|nr:Clp1/GlmU family protein [Nitrososphaera sp.]